MSEHPRAIAAARGLIAEYGITEPESIDLEAIAFDRGVFVREAPLTGSWGRLLRKGSGGVIRISSAIQSEGQKRFCIAHEMGHFLLHENSDQLAFCSSKDMLPWYKSRPEEPEASAFAAEAIMPEQMFRERCPRSDSLRLGHLEQIADDFQATITATAYRFVELGSHMCALVISEGGTTKWFRAGPDFPFRLKGARVDVDINTCAGDFFKHGDSTKMEEDVPATAWLDDERVEETWIIRELLLPMPSFKSALTILWVVPGSPLDSVDL